MAVRHRKPPALLHSCSIPEVLEVTQAPMAWAWYYVSLRQLSGGRRDVAQGLAGIQCTPGAANFTFTWKIPAGALLDPLTHESGCRLAPEGASLGRPCSVVLLCQLRAGRASGFGKAPPIHIRPPKAAWWWGWAGCGARDALVTADVGTSARPVVAPGERPVRPKIWPCGVFFYCARSIGKMC